MKHLISLILSTLIILPSFGQDLVPFEGYMKYGYKDRNSGEVVINPKYYLAQNFSEGLAAVNIDINDKNNRGIELRWGFIDETGKTVIQPKYDKAHPFSEGMAAVNQNGKWGFIDKKGNILIEPQFIEVGSFSEGLAPAIKKLESGYGYIDKTGQFIIKPQFSYAGEFSEGLANVRNSRKERNYLAGYIDKTGKYVIQPIYSDAKPFSNDLASVIIHGRSGYINKKGEFFDTKADAYAAAKERIEMASLTFEEFISQQIKPMATLLSEQDVITSETDLKRKIEKEVAEWQKKGEFETIADYKERVNEQTRRIKAEECAKRVSDENNNKWKAVMAEYKTMYDALAKDYCELQSYLFTTQELVLKPYDAENQTFLISTEKYGDILLPVPIAEAPAFKNDWESIKESVKATFVPTGNDVVLQSVAFGSYVYDSSTNVNYGQVDVAENFRPIEINSLDLSFVAIDDKVSVAPTNGAPVLSKREVNPERTKLEVGAAEVDVNIPTTDHKARHTFALVIANRDYQYASKVNNAENDGRIMAEYLNLTLGLPKENITTCINATYGQIASALTHIEDIGRAYSNDDFNVIFYYVGHGVPDDNNRESYILPVDVNPRNIRVCYPLKEIYSLLGGLGARNVLVMIDACFSGVANGGGMLVEESMGVAIKPKEIEPIGNTVVFTAAQGNESAFPYVEKGHGLFTYWVLRKLQETGGDVSLGELSDYVKNNVSKTSTVINHKPQTPTVSTSPSLIGTWRNISLRK